VSAFWLEVDEGGHGDVELACIARLVSDAMLLIMIRA
jgi:hypothetical protein